jgi:hypothetical protein
MFGMIILSDFQKKVFEVFPNIKLNSFLIDLGFEPMASYFNDRRSVLQLTPHELQIFNVKHDKMILLNV